jgi:hypothetical protein
MTFDFDFIHWLMGRPRSLSASAARAQDGRPGEISALPGYRDGRDATVTASGPMPPGSPFRVGFRASFERAAVEHRATFVGGPPRTSFAVGSTSARPCR